MECVHCAVRTGFVNKIQVIIEYYDQAISRRIITVERRVWFLPRTPSGLWWTKCHRGRLFSRTSAFPCRYIRTVLHTPRYALATVIRRTSERELGAFKERNAVASGQISVSRWILLFWSCRLCHQLRTGTARLRVETGLWWRQDPSVFRVNEGFRLAALNTSAW